MRDEEIRTKPAVQKKLTPDARKRIGFSDYIKGGRVNYKEVVDKIYKDINEKYGTDIPEPQ